LVLLSQSEGLVWYATALLVPCGLVLPLYYSAIIEKVAAILYKRRWILP